MTNPILIFKHSGINGSKEQYLGVIENDLMKEAI